jgi:L-methionine (R)-S-oxide reductase
MESNKSDQLRSLNQFPWQQQSFIIRFINYHLTNYQLSSSLLYLCPMAEDLLIAKGTKEEQYESLLPQIKGLLDGEPDLVANLANVAAALKEQFGWLWVGFYLVKSDELVLGPFQGPVACTRIKKGKGVCGTSWAKAETLIIPDVEKFPGHIACSSLSKSEIVVPVIRNKEVVAVLDVDSVDLNQFDDTDKKYLEKITAVIDF